MKVGDYVRFDYHKVSVPIQIAKITETHYDSEDDSNCYSTDIGLVIDESNLVKEPSPEIINLVQVGDYVNGRKVYQVGYNFQDDLVLKMSINADGTPNNYEDFIYEKDIKSVATKEQFETIKYEVY